MTTLLIYNCVLSSSYTQDAYICQQGQISIKPKPEEPAQRFRIQTCFLQEKNVTFPCDLVLEGGMSKYYLSLKLCLSRELLL